jgi:hypothetical protein
LISENTTSWVIDGLKLQGELVPNKISGVGANFELQVHVLPGPIKRRDRKSSALLS